MATREALISRAKAARAAGRNKEAAEDWGRAVALSPNDGVLYHNWAAALGDLHQYREAAAALEAGFAKGLKAYQSYLVLARAKAGMLVHDEAIVAYRRYLESAPRDVMAQIELAQLIWMQTGGRDRALETLDETIARYPHQGELVVTRCRLLGEMGAPQEAYEGLQTAEARFGPGAAVLSAASSAALACGKGEDAARYAARLVALQPGDGGAILTYALALICTADFRRAQEAIDQLGRTEPLNQYYIALQGDLWRLTGDERQYDLLDYGRLVFRAELEAPEGWSSAEAYVDDLVAALQARHCYQAEPFFQSVRRGSQISWMTTFDDPAMRAFEAAVAGGARLYAQHLATVPGPAGERSRGGAALVGAWSVQLPPGGFHADHVHPAGWVSSACHLVSGEADGTGGGWLKFGECSLPTNPRLAAQYFVRPQDGVVVFFPSYLWHGTLPLEAGDRLTVAADFSPL